MNKEEIKQILPHREPMLLVDEVELIDGKAHGKCHIKGDEFFLQGHFPGNPVVPGVIQCEMLAQSACVLLANGAAEGATPLFTSLDKVKFRGQVKPGDTLETECEITRQRGALLLRQGQGHGKRQTVRQRRVLLRPHQGGVTALERMRACSQRF